MPSCPSPEAFDRCPALDGYHCQTNSLAKIFYFHGHPLSEDLLLGLGAGMGFIYWQMRQGAGSSVFIGGRGNTNNFFQDLGQRTGVTITAASTSSARKARTSLIAQLARREPVMLFGDMGFLPWFDLSEDYHFGGHTFVVCGFDGANTVLASDLDQQASGLKRGFYAPITLDQLEKARGSPFKPFPPKNTALTFDFQHFHQPIAADVLAAIRQTVDAQLHPPIRNLGVKGLRHTSKELVKWPTIFTDEDLRMQLFNLYLFIEIGGTGGGCFRYMYARFLHEASDVTGKAALRDAAELFQTAGEKFTEIGCLFQDAETMENLDESIAIAARAFNDLADIEEHAYHLLSEHV